MIIVSLSETLLSFHNYFKECYTCMRDLMKEETNYTPHTFTSTIHL